MKNFTTIKQDELKMIKGGILSETLREGWVMPKTIKVVTAKLRILSETLHEDFVMPDKE